MGEQSAAIEAQARPVSHADETTDIGYDHFTDPEERLRVAMARQ